MRQVMRRSLLWSSTQAEAIRYRLTWLRAGEERLEDHIVVPVVGIDLDGKEGVMTFCFASLEDGDGRYGNEWECHAPLALAQLIS